MTEPLKVKIAQFNRETGEPVQLFQGTLNGFLTQYGNLDTGVFTFRDLRGTVWEDVTSVFNLPTLADLEDPDAFASRQAREEQRAAAARGFQPAPVAAPSQLQVPTPNEEDWAQREEGPGTSE